MDRRRRLAKEFRELPDFIGTLGGHHALCRTCIIEV